MSSPHKPTALLLKPRFFYPLTLILMVVFSHSLSADAVRAEIRWQAAQSGPVWVGQELELNLDLFSTGLSFSAQQFSLPRIDGAYLLQADSSTVKLSETRGGETWQGLRYTFLLYSQRAGALEIPPFEVRFAASAAFGSEAEPFRFTTPALNIEAVLPARADPRALLVTTTDFQLSAAWEPAVSDARSTQLKTGDALKLTIRRSAADVPAMVFSPLPDFDIDGLRAYVSAPVVLDKVNRGKLAGSRTDSVTFVCEQAGSYQMPDILFQWWDPEREQMNEETVQGISFEVVVNPVFKQSETPETGTSRWLWSWWQVLVGVAVLLIVLFAGRWCKSALQRVLRKRREKREAGEAWAFRQVQKLCRAGNAAQAYRAINLWLTRLEPSVAARTLLELAQHLANQELQVESERLQSAVARGGEAGWEGRKLAELLSCVRVEHSRQANESQQLPPLNPANG